MFGDKSLTKILIVWAFLTLVIVLALMGTVTIANYTKLSGGTCSSIGGKWTTEHNEYVCTIERKEEK